MQNESNGAGKAFYVLLCAILGALLFLVIQRAAALIYYLLLNTNYQTYSLGMNYFQLSWLNFLTILAAIFFGLWYGVWLGMHWYNLVYEQGQGGLFHGFRGHWLRHEGILSKQAPTPAGNTVKPVARTFSQPAKPPAKLTDRLESDSWDLDELMKKDQPAVKTKTVKPRPPSVKRKAPAKRMSPPTV